MQQERIPPLASRSAHGTPTKSRFDRPACDKTRIIKFALTQLLVIPLTDFAMHAFTIRLRIDLC